MRSFFEKIVGLFFEKRKKRSFSFSFLFRDFYLKYSRVRTFIH